MPLQFAHLAKQQPRNSVNLGSNSDNFRSRQHFRFYQYSGTLAKGCGLFSPELRFSLWKLESCRGILGLRTAMDQFGGKSRRKKTKIRSIISPCPIRTVAGREILNEIVLVHSHKQSPRDLWAQRMSHSLVEVNKQLYQTFVWRSNCSFPAFVQTSHCYRYPSMS